MKICGTFIPAFGLTLSWNKLTPLFMYIFIALDSQHQQQKSLFLNSDDSMSPTETNGDTSAMPTERQG